MCLLRLGLIENANTLNLLDVEYSSIENVCDLDFELCKMLCHADM